MRSNPPDAARTAGPTRAEVHGAGSGIVMFAQFAYPPNRLGLCGPADSAALLEYTAAGQGDAPAIGSRGPDWRGLRQLALGFEGAWPYLQLIAAANHIDDPLDARVVEAYWIGNELLATVRVALLGNSLDERFRRRAGRHWQYLSESLESGARPHHNFHVFGVYPWVGLLRGAQVSEPLRILDQCRVRWARVEAVLGDEVIVRGSALRWDGRGLRLGPAESQHVHWRHDDHRLVQQPQPGQMVALHWDWACHPLDDRQLSALRRETARHLAHANRTLSDRAEPSLGR
jgi:Family of unknown function (DUF6390)